MRTRQRASGVALLFTLLTACSGATTLARVDGGPISAPTRSRSNWLTHGRTYGAALQPARRGSTTSNVGELGLAWYADIESRTARGLEATPIVVDGVTVRERRWSNVLALDAQDRQALWEFDPKFPARMGQPAAATSSIAASRSGAATCSSAHMTAG